MRHKSPEIFVGDADELTSTDADSDRNCILVFGGWLEFAVTSYAISALLKGYSVFVISDLCVYGDIDHRSLYLDRIRGCGGTITTRRQVERELFGYSPPSEYSGQIEPQRGDCLGDR